jgi:hypothetical protein
MKRVTRTRRWQPVFRAGHQGRVFFYSGAAPAGPVAFFHRHHGDARPHLHLVEESPHEHRVHDEHRHERTHRHEHADGSDRIAERASGHWHFAYAVSPACLPHLLQFIAIKWVDFSRALVEWAICPHLIADHWARPPPL